MSAAETARFRPLSCAREWASRATASRRRATTWSLAQRPALPEPAHHLGHALRAAPPSRGACGGRAGYYGGGGGVGGRKGSLSSSSSPQNSGGGGGANSQPRRAAAGGSRDQQEAYVRRAAKAVAQSGHPGLERCCGFSRATSSGSGACSAWSPTTRRTRPVAVRGGGSK